MNKDVIYIEPEDDITDIITKIENSKEKIVALVPPKKAGVLRSIVNIRLICKTGNKTGKKIVLVTADPSVIRLAAATKLPVTKNLQSAPSVPELDAIVTEEIVATEEVVEDGDTIVAKEVGNQDETEQAEDNNAENVDDEKKNDTKIDDKKDKKNKKKDVKLSANPFVAWVQSHKPLVIGGSVGIVVLIVVLVWAFAIAPAVTVTVGIRTVSSNFSENVTFTEKLTDEKVSEGIFYLETKKLEEKAEATFEATGSKNVGEKAKGELVIYKYFKIDSGGVAAVNAGTAFRIDDLTFVADADSTLSWDGDLKTLEKDCENYNEPNFSISKTCLVTRKITVTAENPGAKYNISPSVSSKWITSAGIDGAYSETAMAGGTDVMVSIVQQSDVDEAISKLKMSNESANKEKLLKTIGEGNFAIETSFKQTVGEPVVTPKVGEEVKEGEKPKLSVTTTDTIYVLDKTKVENFISEKAKLAESYKIYSMNDPFVENFLQTEEGYVGKLKTSYVSGPKVTENEIVEIIKGKGLGVAQHDIKDIDGVSSIKIDTSYPWVMSIPGDPNKITVNIEVEE